MHSPVYLETLFIKSSTIEYSFSWNYYRRNLNTTSNYCKMKMYVCIEYLAIVLIETLQ